MHLYHLRDQALSVSGYGDQAASRYDTYVRHSPLSIELLLPDIAFLYPLLANSNDANMTWFTV